MHAARKTRTWIFPPVSTCWQTIVFLTNKNFPPSKLRNGAKTCDWMQSSRLLFRNSLFQGRLRGLISCESWLSLQPVRLFSKMLNKSNYKSGTLMFIMFSNKKTFYILEVDFESIKVNRFDTHGVVNRHAIKLKDFISDRTLIQFVLEVWLRSLQFKSWRSQFKSERMSFQSLFLICNLFVHWKGNF